MQQTPTVDRDVAQEYPNDVGRGVARIDSMTLRALDIEVGEYVAIEGERVTAGKVWRLANDERNMERVRLDQFTRKSAGVTSGDSVTLQPVEPRPADEVTLKPLDEAISHDFEEWKLSEVARQHQGRAIVREDTFPVFVTSDGDLAKTPVNIIRFQTVETAPSGVVKITSETELSLQS